MTKILDLVNTLAGWLNSLIEFLVTIGLAVLFSVTIIEVGGRYFFKYSFSWIPEAAGYLLSFVAFMGVSCLVYKRSLMSIDYLYKRFPAKVKALLSIIIWLLVIFYARVLVTAGYAFAVRASGQMSPSLVFQLTHVRMIIPIAGLLIAFQAFNNLLKDMREAVRLFKDPESVNTIGNFCTPTEQQ